MGMGEEMGELMRDYGPGKDGTRRTGRRRKEGGVFDPDPRKQKLLRERERESERD